jgi:hypothetical protein
LAEAKAIAGTRFGFDVRRKMMIVPKIVLPQNIDRKNNNNQRKSNNKIGLQLE